VSRSLLRRVGLLVLAIASPATAAVVDTPECRRDLAMADQLIHGIRLREGQMKRDDIPGACRLLRQNLDDMVRARGPMDRCVTGHDRGENVAQIDASIGDIRDVLARNCRGR
jgi:hypothetical protein